MGNVIVIKEDLRDGTIKKIEEFDFIRKMKKKIAKIQTRRQKDLVKQLKKDKNFVKGLNESKEVGNASTIKIEVGNYMVTLNSTYNTITIINKKAEFNDHASISYIRKSR